MSRRRIVCWVRPLRTTALKITCFKNRAPAPVTFSRDNLHTSQQTKACFGACTTSLASAQSTCHHFVMRLLRSILFRKDRKWVPVGKWRDYRENKLNILVQITMSQQKWDLKDTRWQQEYRNGICPPAVVLIKIVVPNTLYSTPLAYKTWLSSAFLQRKVSITNKVLQPDHDLSQRNFSSSVLNDIYVPVLF